MISLEFLPVALPTRTDSSVVLYNLYSVLTVKALGYLFIQQIDTLISWAETSYQTQRNKIKVNLLRHMCTSALLFRAWFFFRGTFFVVFSFLFFVFGVVFTVQAPLST